MIVFVKPKYFNVSLEAWKVPNFIRTIKYENKQYIYVEGFDNNTLTEKIDLLFNKL